MTQHEFAAIGSLTSIIEHRKRLADERDAALQRAVDAERREEALREALADLGLSWRIYASDADGLYHPEAAVIYRKCSKQILAALSPADTRGGQ